MGEDTNKVKTRSFQDLDMWKAEGYRKKETADKARFYNISQGSLEECRYYLILARDLHYAETQQLETELDRIGRMLDSYITTTLAR